MSHRINTRTSKAPKDGSVVVKKGLRYKIEYRHVGHVGESATVFDRYLKKLKSGRAIRFDDQHYYCKWKGDIYKIVEIRGKILPPTLLPPPATLSDWEDLSLVQANRATRRFPIEEVGQELNDLMTYNASDVLAEIESLLSYRDLPYKQFKKILEAIVTQVRARNNNPTRWIDSGVPCAGPAWGRETPQNAELNAELDKLLAKIQKLLPKGRINDTTK